MQPNILFLFPDQHRHDWLGCAGNLPLNTPNLDNLAQEGTRFTRCYTPSPICSPARACLATGRRYTRTEVSSNGQNTPVDLPNYYRMLRDGGYQVSGVGKFDLHKPDLNWGPEGKAMLDEYGFTSGCDNEGKGDAITAYNKNGDKPVGPYMHHLQKQGVLESYRDIYFTNGKRHGLCFSAINPLPSDDYCDNWVGKNALKEIQNFKKEKPWHLVVNFVGPHDPYDVLPEMEESTKYHDFPKAHANDKNDPDEILLRQRYYAAMIENIDKRVGELIAAVEKRGELNNTLIIYCSDHGEMLGDHNRWAKGVMHEASSHVPLIVKGPNVRSGQIKDDLISMHDISAMILEAANIPLDEGMDAVSPWPALKGEDKPSRSHLSIGLGNWRLLVEGDYKYVLTKDGEQRLINLKNDPLEDGDLSLDPNQQDKIKKYRGILEKEVPFTLINTQKDR